MLLTVAATAWSCALSTPPTREDTETKALPPTTQIPPRWAPGSSADAQVTNDWVTSFNDAGLERVVTEAIANNTDLRQAAAQVDMARQAAILVGAQLKPHIGIDAGGQVTRDLLPDLALTIEGGRFNDRILDILHLNPNLIGVGFRLFQPVFEGGALRTRIRIATARQEQMVANYGSVALRAFREVEVALTNEALLGEQLRYENQALAQSSETVRIATRKYRAGALSLLPVLQLQTRELATRAEIIQLRDTQLANRIQLHLALGGQS